MREIKFRGKVLFDGNHKFNGDWIYGYYRTNEHGNYFITETIDDIGNYIFKEIEVEEKSIGQYTGLKDKNGVEIYEGDIVKAHYIIGHGVKMKAVIFDAGTFVIDYNVGCKLLLNEFNFCSEVIGNIHDNPELLKEE